MNNDDNKLQFRDVIIVGAGISGLGAACHLQNHCPEKSYLILEGRDSIGGTWDLFRYPGIRSDSDLYTFGYEFKPWHGKPIATASEIMGYLHEVVDEHKLQQHIHFNHWVKNSFWSSSEALWTIETKVDGKTEKFQCRFLFMCQGYYSYEAGYRPYFPGEESFQGQIIHPQKWPEDLDYTDKNMVVIGSGATAATIVPAVSERVAHVTQLQRSPSYYLALDNDAVDPTVEDLKSLDMPAKLIHEVRRRKALLFGQILADRSRLDPQNLKQELVDAARASVPEDFDVEKHLTPKYDPWKERLCLLPNGDLFNAISTGKASIVTDHIDRFVSNGILLKSGKTLTADIIITATGIELCGLGNMGVHVDGKQINLADTWTYKGIMVSEIPNLAWIFGYVRTSWTMRSDMIAKYVCRLLKYMDAHNVRQCTPRLRSEDQGINGINFIDTDDFGPGYIRRGSHLLPKQGNEPWTNIQDYYVEKDLMPTATFDDGALIFDNTG